MVYFPVIVTVAIAQRRLNTRRCYIFKILVVDDSPMMRDGLARLLGLMGYTVSTATNGKIAWTTLYDDLPDLIVLDLMMPEMGGVIFLRMLRDHNHWSDLPVLVLTGLDPDEGLVESAKQLGVVDVIHKGGDSVNLLLNRLDALFPSGAGPTPLTVDVAAGRAGMNGPSLRGSSPQQRTAARIPTAS